MEWCNHQHEIEHRAEEWARCVENSHYFHYGDPKGKFKAKATQPELVEAIEKAPTWNQQQTEAARDRIKRAIADLLEKETLPARATTRFRALLKYNIGGGSLYRHRDLWHPSFLVDIPPDPPSSIEVSSLDCVKDASNEPNSTSLLYRSGGDNNGDAGLSDHTVQFSSGSGGNFSEEQPYGDSDPDSSQSIRYVQQVLFDLKAQQEARQEAVRVAQEQQGRIKQEAAETKQIARMEHFLDSGDPILVAEALAWAQVNPGVLRSKPLLSDTSTEESSDERIYLE